MDSIITWLVTDPVPRTVLAAVTVGNAIIMLLVTIDQITRDNRDNQPVPEYTWW